MAKDIAFKIYIPSKMIADEKIYRAIIPYGGKNLTVMKGRAPLLLALDMGVISILDEDMQVVNEYLIANGAADITENSCTILTEGAYSVKDLTLEKVNELRLNTSNSYYDWMAKYLENRNK